jgi:hypothetical protein
MLRWRSRPPPPGWRHVRHPATVISTARARRHHDEVGVAGRRPHGVEFGRRGSMEMQGSDTGSRPTSTNACLTRSAVSAVVVMATRTQVPVPPDDGGGRLLRVRALGPGASRPVVVGDEPVHPDRRANGSAKRAQRRAAAGAGTFQHQRSVSTACGSRRGRVARATASAGSPARTSTASAPWAGAGTISSTAEAVTDGVGSPDPSSARLRRGRWRRTRPIPPWRGGCRRCP